MKVYFAKRESKKDKTRSYVCLYVDLGYCEKILTFDKDTIVEVLKMSFEEFALLPVGTVCEVGNIDLKNLKK